MHRTRSLRPAGALLLFGTLLALLLAAAPHRADARAAVRAPKPVAFGQPPLAFEPNLGQTDPTVRYLARGRGYTLFVTPGEAVLSVVAPQRTQRAQRISGGLARREAPAERTGITGIGTATRASGGQSPRRPMTSSLGFPSVSSVPSVVNKTAIVRMRLAGADRSARVSAAKPRPGRSHYLTGADPTRWLTDVPQFGRVTAHQVYPGVDVVYYGRDGELEYDFQLAPGADARRIRLELTGIDGARLEKGDLVLSVAGAELRQRRPIAYQTVQGRRVPVAARFRVDQVFGSPGIQVLGTGSRPKRDLNTRGAQPRIPEYLNTTRIGFEVGAYDKTRPLVIDPVLVYSTFMGGNGGAAAVPPDEAAYGIAVDANGAAYVAGFTTSANFPLSSPFQGTHGGQLDAFVMKLNALGQAQVYSTFLGGSGDDWANGIAIDADRNAYVAGGTVSTNFPTTSNAIRSTNGGGTDAWTAKLAANGASLTYSTYMGGAGTDVATGIAVDAIGAAAVSGWTTSGDFPTLVPLQPNRAGTVDAFVYKINAAGAALTYSTYLGGAGEDRAWGIAVDGNGNAFVTGRTASSDFPTTVGAFDRTWGGSSEFVYDAFVTRIATNGASLNYSTFLGGTATDEGFAIAIDGSGNAYVAGETASSNFPTISAFQGTLHGFVDGFVTRVNGTGTALGYSTYLGGTTVVSGGSDADRAWGIDVHTDGTAFVTGYTGSNDFPTANAIQGLRAGGLDAFVTRFAANGTSVLYSTFLGGTLDDYGKAIAAGPSGDAYVTGFTTSTNFPTVDPFQPTYGGGRFDAFVTRIGESLGNPPNRPTNLRATAPSATRIDLTWIDNSLDEATFEVERKELGGLFSRIGQLPQNATSMTDINRSPNTTYVYRVRACNAAGCSAYSNEAQVTTPIPTPARPTNLVATPVEETQIDLTWTDNSPSETSFQIERRTVNTLYQLLTSVPADTTSYSDTTVSPGTTYFYRVRAVNSGGASGYSNESSARTPSGPAPDAPTNLEAEVTSAVRVDLTWVDNSSNETSFIIERKDGEPGDLDDYDPVGSVGPNVQLFSDRTVTGKHTYTYRVIARGSGGDSAPSNEVTVTTPNNPNPGKLTISPSKLGFGSVQIGKSRSKTLTLRNTGSGPLSVTIDLGDPPFGVSPAGTRTIAAGKSLELTVRFSPTAAGNFSQKLVIESDDPNRRTASVQLTGKGTKKRRGGGGPF